MAVIPGNENTINYSSLDELQETLKLLIAQQPNDDNDAEIRVTAQGLLQQCIQLRAENELLQKQNHQEIYRRIFDNSFGSNAILEKTLAANGRSAEWVFRHANQRLAGFFGRVAADLPGRLVTEVLGSSSGILDALAVADQACEAGEPAELTGHLEKYGWNFQARLIPLGENLVAFVGMDISPRLQLEREMRVFETLAENIPEGVAVADSAREIVSMVSRYGRQQVGLADRLMVDLPLSDIASVWHVYDPTSGAPAALEELPLIRSLRTGEVIENEEWLLDAEDGTRITIAVHSVPVRDQDGSITGAVVVWQDITEQERQSAEREKLQASLSQEHSRLQAILECAPDGISVTDINGKVIYRNPVAERLRRSPSLTDDVSEVFEAPVVCYPDGAVCPPEDYPILVAMRTGENIVNYEMLYKWSDGNTRSVLISTAPIRSPDGDNTGGVAVFQDVTDRNALVEQASLRAVKIQLHHHLIYQREQERLKIAQDLHDGPIQELYGMVYTLRAIEGEMSGRQALFELRSVEESLQTLARDLRTFCNELRPPSLGSFGLQSAIHSMADNLAARFPGLKISLDLDDGGKALPPEVRLGLFRVCQELLGNAARHSSAEQLQVALRLEADRVSLIVSDDGHGFTVPADWMDLAREGHLGLIGVQERVDALGGKLEIDSSEGNGTTVVVHVDIQPHC